MLPLLKQAKVQVQLPLLIFGAISCLGAVITLFLPETSGEDLPNTIEDANIFGADQRFGYCVVCTSKDDKAEAPSPVVVEESTLRKRLSLIPKVATLPRIPTLPVIVDPEGADERLFPQS